MAKVIKKDNYNRDYQPEKLVTVSVSLDEAELIAEALNNNQSGDNYYEVVADDYQLNLESMYDCTGVIPPDGFYAKLLGIDALENEPNLNIIIKN